MTIAIDFPDDVQMGKAISGSLFLTGEGKGNFRPYKRNTPKKRKYKKLAHGSVSYGEERTMLHLSICHDEGLCDAEVILDEADDACSWLEIMHNS